MKLYTINDLNRGAGVFDHVMRTYAEFPSYHEAMPGADAIGVVGAAVKSGLNHKQLEQVLSTHFDGPTGEVLLNVWRMYTGAAAPRAAVRRRSGGHSGAAQVRGLPVADPQPDHPPPVHGHQAPVADGTGRGWAAGPART